MQEVTSALRSGKEGPDVIGEMRLLEAFWTRYGVTEEQIRRWPPQRVRDYITVLTVEHALNSEQKPAGSPTGGGRPEMSAADMTEAAYQAMRSEPVQPVGPHPSEAVRAERAKLFE